MSLVEEAQEEAGVGVVVRFDRILVGVDLPEEQRLKEAPDVCDRVAVVERCAQRERLQHVAVEVDVATHIGLGDVALVEAAYGLHRFVVVKRCMEQRVAAPRTTHLAVGQLDRERFGDGSRSVNEGIDRLFGHACRHV